jgi:hypothetical protein
MEGLLILLIILLVLIGIGLLILPIVSTVLAVRARRMARETMDELQRIELRLRQLEGAPLEPASSTEREPPHPEPDAPEPAPPSSPSPAPSLEESSPEIPVPGGSSPEAPQLAAEPPKPPPPADPPRSLEEKIGLVWLTRIGAILGIAVAGWFFKYMTDNEWIGPWGRVALGALAGAGLLVWSEFIGRRGKTHPLFVQGLLGLGLAVLLVTTYASFAFYHLVPLTAAFAGVAVVCALGGALAVRHRAEAILGLALLGALLNPIMLSTGHDRPLALFSYLLVITGGALVVSVRMNFRLALGGAVLGVVALFIGWYARFFDAHPPYAPGTLDLPPEEQVGAYFALSARWAPLLFGALFPALWLATAQRLFARGQRKLGLGLSLVALGGVQAAAAALLYDHRLLLAGVLCALALVAAVWLVRARATPFLGLPMVFSFLVLAALSDDLPRSHRLPMLALAGALAALFAGSVLWSARREGWLRSFWALALVSASAVGLALLGSLWLGEHHPIPLAWLVTALAGLLCALGVVARSAVMLVWVLPASLVALGGATGGLTGTEPGLIAAAVAWFLIHVGAVSLDLFALDAPWTRGRQAVLAGAGAGFLIFLLAATPESAELLRAALTLGAGVVYLLVGLRMRAAGRLAGQAPLLPLGASMAFFSLALSFLLQGPGLTAAWALMGAVLAWLAAREESPEAGQPPGHPAWLVGSLALLGLAVLHMLSVDLRWVWDQHWLFRTTLGAEGVLLPAPFAHPLAWSLLALAAACLVGARAFLRARARWSFSVSALGLFVVAHLCLLGLAIHEVRLAATPAPGVPAGLPPEELSAFLARWDVLVEAAATRLSMFTTLVLGLYALALLGLGFGLRDKLHRFLGLGLFGVTILKLGLADIWALDTLYRIVVGGGIAALLLSAAFLYGRFGSRIREMLTDGGDKP